VAPPITLRSPVSARAAAAFTPEARHHRRDAQDIEGAAQIVDERGQAELGADIFEAARQERALVHPLLDAAEGMLVSKYVNAS
jgi:hypothetical protein